jgi:four helix bundle protein
MEDRFDFENLKVYQKALDYIDFVYKITESFPREEQFALTSNFQRAAQSIALNIGEGSGGTKTEFKYFIRISSRSIKECIVCTAIARRRNYLGQKEEDESRAMCVELSKMLSGLKKSLDRDWL